MGKPQKYTEQFPVVCTPVQKALIKALSVDQQDFMAFGVREAVDLLFGLDDGNLVTGGGVIKNADGTWEVDRTDPGVQAALARANAHISGDEPIDVGYGLIDSA